MYVGGHKAKQSAGHPLAGHGHLVNIPLPIDIVPGSCTLLRPSFVQDPRTLKEGSRMKLEGKVALITGGGTGIGAAIAERFVAEGARVCISGRREEVLEKTAKSLPPGTVAICAGDTGKDEHVSRMVAKTLEFAGKIDVLVNNAAISANGPVADMDRKVWRQVMDVNLNGPFMLMQEVIPHMIKNGGGSIINIASVGGLRCLPGMPAYCVSKAGLIMLTQQAALDYGPHKIRVNAICPGAIKTEMVEKEFGRIGRTIGMEPPDFFSMISKVLPLQRFGNPQEIGGICAFLASDDSSFMTGSAIVIDAGAAVALATDFNPGTSPTVNLPLMLTLGVSQLRMSVAEVVIAATVNGAAALGLAQRVGQIAPGMSADLALFDIDDVRELPYWYGDHRCVASWARGKTCYPRDLRLS